MFLGPGLEQFNRQKFRTANSILLHQTVWENVITKYLFIKNLWDDKRRRLYVNDRSCLSVFLHHPHHPPPTPNTHSLERWCLFLMWDPNKSKRINLTLYFELKVAYTCSLMIGIDRDKRKQYRKRCFASLLLERSLQGKIVFPLRVNLFPKGVSRCTRNPKGLHNLIEFAYLFTWFIHSW